MEEVKTVYIALIYQADVPADMSMDAINEAVYGQFEAPSDNAFRLSVSNYKGEEESDPLFMLDSASAGETVNLQIG